MKHVFTKLIEGLLMISSSVTTLAVLLIILFLFKEGVGIFGKSPTEEGFVIVLNKSNPVNSLSGLQVKDIFDQNINNWSELGGKKDSIIIFRLDDIFNYYTEQELTGIDENPALLAQKMGEVISKNSGMITVMSTRNIANSFPAKIIEVDKINLQNYFAGREWFPTAQPVAQFGILPILLGTLWVSLLSILFALPFGLAVSIYMAEIAPARIRNILKPIIELLAGIPSVVYGFFGLIVAVPLVQKTFDLPVGETGLTGSIILGIMALPTIITISEDAIRNTPRIMKEASLALGASHWQTIYRVIIPYSISGITAAAILGVGRAIGETMAVLMVTGNAAVIPHSILEPMRTIPATIAAELGEAAKGGLHYQALFALGCILFIITMLINLLVEMVSGKQNKKMH